MKKILCFICLLPSLCFSQYFGPPYNPASVSITGGTINGATLGAITPAPGAFTTLSSTGTSTLRSIAGDGTNTLFITNTKAITSSTGNNASGSSFGISFATGTGTTGTGNIAFAAGTPSAASSVGGNISFAAGSPSASGTTGGTISLTAGNGKAVGGAIEITAGDGDPTTGDGGDIILTPGAGNGASSGSVVLSDPEDTFGMIVSNYGAGTLLGFFDKAANATPAAKPTVTGIRNGNPGLASLLTGLSNLGLVTDSTTAGAIDGIAIGAVTPSTGAFTSLSLTAGGTTWVNDNTYNIGAVGASRPANIYVGTNGFFGGNINVGTASLTVPVGGIGISKITADGVAPGAGGGKLQLVCGTNAGTAKLVISAGTSATAVTVVDNIGAGVTGC